MTRLSFLLYSAILCLSTSLQAQDINRLEPSILEAFPPSSVYAAYIYDLESNKVLLSKNSEQLMSPASTLKLLTAVAATRVLGNDFRFKTDIATKHAVHSERILGNLYIRFHGDPTLSSDSLMSLLQGLKQKGVKRVDGDVILVGDDQAPSKAPGWVWDDLGICYAAPVSAFMIDGNCVPAALVPQLATYVGKVVKKRNLPITVNSNATFDKKRQQAFCKLEMTSTYKNYFYLTGCHQGDRSLNLEIAVNNPKQFALDIVRQQLNSLNIKVRGQIRLTDVSPMGLVTIGTVYSPPLSQMVEAVLLESNNLISDGLLKQLGRQLYGGKQSFEKGVAALKRTIQREGIDLSEAVIVDGSGLSRYNLISATQLANVLKLIATRPLYQHILQNLPIAGVSGTLKYRAGFNRETLRHRVQAKTGSMQGMSNFAGFIMNKQGEPTYAFVILENGLSLNGKTTNAATALAKFISKK